MRPYLESEYGSAIGIRRGVTNGAPIGGVELVTPAGGDFGCCTGARTIAVRSPR
ncbi:MAG TPA: hypothetical protein VNY05_18735 [Candidatus Acidoferrales bacterium]|nr:hypothetical protein [Candidatus Acidoferrales bacterium]